MATPGTAPAARDSPAPSPAAAVELARRGGSSKQVHDLRRLAEPRFFLRLPVAGPPLGQRLAHDRQIPRVIIEPAQVLLRIPKDEIQASLQRERDERILQTLADLLRYAERKVRQADGDMDAPQLGVFADQ